MRNLEHEVIRTISEVICMESSKIKPESKLIADLELDSLDQVELSFGIEDDFLGGTQIPDEEIEKFNTVQDIIDYVKKNVKN